MKLHADRTASGYRVTAYGTGFITVNETVFTSAILLAEDELATDFEERKPDDLSAATITRLRAYDPEVIIIGTGARHVFPPTALFAPLLRDRIGVELMSTSAACRTYNILRAERRKIVALLLPIGAVND